MKCLDHIDLAALTGAVTVAGCAAFLFAWLGVTESPIGPPEPAAPETFLAEQMDRAIAEAMAGPARADKERGLTQEALGSSIVGLQQATAREAAWIPELAASARAAAKRRRAFLETRFKLPADWGGPEFAMMEQRAEAMAQPWLGRRIVTEGRAIMARVGAAEEAYGRTLLAATQALERAAREPAASQQTLAAAAMTAMTLAERTAGVPGPALAREVRPGDDTILPLGILGAGVLLIAVGVGALASLRGPSSRRFTAHCGTAGKDVEVTVLLSDDTPYEVTGCSAFNGGPVTCGKHCLKWPMAHAA